MISKSAMLVGGLIGGAIVLHGFVTRQDEQRYQLSAGGDQGRTVWRLETQTGRISMCGSVLTGPAFSAMATQMESAMTQAARSGSNEAIAKAATDSANMELTADPKCTDWSQ
jgi:hypothetical protein